MRRRRLKKLWKRLKELEAMKQSRDQLLMRLGAARNEAGRAWGLVSIRTPEEGEPVDETTFDYVLEREKLREARRREGNYLIRSNLPVDPKKGEPDGATVWKYYMQMVDVHLPVSDGPRLQMARYTQPDRDLGLLMKSMGLELPPQPPPRVSSTGRLAAN